MQTFFPYCDPCKSAQILDNKRLGKQRVETIQIARCLFGVDGRIGWQNHPAVKMWQGYEPYLIRVYLVCMIGEWARRGYSNTKSYEHYVELLKYVKDKLIVKPHWLNDELCRTHRSNLLRKDSGYYSKYFNEPYYLEYIWPV